MTMPSPIVIFGAGNLGRRVACAVQPIAFCDNKQALWGTAVDGIPVESPANSVERYPHATFVVAIWHPSRTESMTDRIAQLKSLGVQNVLPFTALLPEYGNSLLPHLLWERPAYYAAHEEKIAQARALLDEAGREEFDRQLRLRMGDHSAQVIDPGVQYFPEDLFQLREDEVFIDCGAYDGDTIADFRRISNDRFARIVAFEPDPANFASLKSAVDGNPRVSLYPYAAGVRRETLRFSFGGTASHVSSGGSYEVQAITLDEVLGDSGPTYIKFDIEGSEPDALEGGRESISRHRPRMAVCLYHAPDHLWSLILRLNELLPDSRFTVRTYAADGFECVCYCLPR